MILAPMFLEGEHDIITGIFFLINLARKARNMTWTPYKKVS